MLSSSSTTGSEKICNCSTHNHKRLHRVSSSSTSTSSSSSPSLHLHHHHHHHHHLHSETMEEVWNDINLASLNDHHTPSNSTSSYRSVIFQDFLARSPFDPPATGVSPPPHDNTTSSFYGPGSPAPPLFTALSLGSTGPDFHFDLLNNKHIDSPAHAHAHAQTHTHTHTHTSAYCTHPFDALAYASGLSPMGNKRQLAAESDRDYSNNSSGNLRHKRMIKNRESAARSRARKQAYTNELEQKVDYLSKENERLKKQQEQWCKALGTHKKKNPLYRTSTAPF